MTAPPVIGAPALPGTATPHIDRDDALGVVFVSRDPSLLPQPVDWRAVLAQSIKHLGVGVVGVKRLDAQGNVFAMGDFAVHPKGFHYHGKGTPGHAYRFPEEVDAVSGGLLAIDAPLFDQVGGDALCAGELGMLSLCLAARERGGRCVATPSVVVTDGKALSPSEDEAARFTERFGFDWLAADLEEVVERYRGTPLLWNARFWGHALPFEKYDQRGAMHWASYAQVDVYKQRADHLAKLVGEQTPSGGRALDLGCGDGLFTHLVALQGVEAVGLDLEAAAIEQARQQVAAQAYPGATPVFELGTPGPLPFDDASFDTVYAFDVIEHLPNPVAVLGEAMRVLRPGGTLIISTPAWQFGGSSDPTYHVTEYSAEELTRQINAVGRGCGLQVVHLGKIGGVYRDLVAVAKRP